MHGTDVARTLERHESRERWRSKIGYGQTMQFAALDRECKLLSRLADDIRAQMTTSTDEWILVFRNKECDPDNLALVTLDTLITSIIRRHSERKAAIKLGRAAHGEAWAANLLIDDKTTHRRISKINDPRKRAAVATRAGYQGEKIQGRRICEFHSRAGRLTLGLDFEHMFARKHAEHLGGS